MNSKNNLFNLKKLSKIFLGILLIFSFIFAADAEAYVRVKGYYKSNGIYVAPHVRSNPNGLRYDNYGWKPSQGLYNKTYGTRGKYWDTPTYITDFNYYEGKALYESKSVGIYKPKIIINRFTTTKSKFVSTNAHLNSTGKKWYCDKGYKKIKNYCQKIIVPANAHLSKWGRGWYCDNGYRKVNNYCVAR
ncbi:hypothetical protein K8R42_01395 [bacterium]|nr:hypothetical protein [bacterium]